MPRRALLLACLILPLLSGCGWIGAIAYYLRPPKKIDPEFKLTTGKVAIMIDFARPGEENPLFTKAFFDRYEKEWRPKLCAQFPMPQGDPATWTRPQMVHSWYHNPDYTMPEPYAEYPSHLHIDLLDRAQGRGFGRRMIEMNMDQLRRKGSPGTHLGVSMMNTPAYGFYLKLGFKDLVRVGEGRDGCIYMGKRL